MSYAISRRGVRTATAVGAVSLGLLALSACEKPSPMATATVNSTSVSTEAACYNDGDTIAQSEAKSCLSKEAEKSVTAGPGDKVRIGVEPDVAEGGWLLFIDGQPVLPEPIKKTYYTFPGEAFFQSQTPTGQAQKKDSAQVSIVQADGSQFKGIWHLKLKNGS
ncbi:DUF2771 domain-containing protein [Streptomyces sp. HNM0574]|uniref:DUF2771 domain-containing protein n=1 Tax=Streptomyces sp. HNM0574 TaxID=2714954 RepID=UPI00146BB805|nr:DUF2771 domain-containing protein [Streptomyces sp. HNM0574]NLU70969.1 DUF2771 domain-containing protein [Streptomyces sp. HNM0574]